MKGDFGSILVQEDYDEGFKLRLSVFKINQPIDISVLVQQNTVMFTYMLKGESFIALSQYEDDIIEEGAYYLLYAPAGEHPVRLEAGSYTIIHVELSLELVNTLAFKHFVMYEMMVNLNEKWHGGLLRGPYGMNGRIRETLEKLFGCSLEHPERSLYQQARVMDLLVLFAEDMKKGTFQRAPGKFNFTAEDIKAIKEAGALKIERISDGLTVKDIAKEANLHPKKLQAGFKMVYGQSTRELINETKMEKAKALLLESDRSIADIAYETGYANGSSFIRAFKRYVGVTPAAYRK